jgi:hypothetical protein
MIERNLVDWYAWSFVKQLSVDSLSRILEINKTFFFGFWTVIFESDSQVYQHKIVN